MVVCSMFELQAGQTKAYEALSYCWGKPDRLVDIVCNGRRMKVTPNLRAALQNLRKDDSNRMLWVDAMCINQDDVAEKSVQVQRMKETYSDAEHVIVWLGEAMEDSDEIMDLIAAIEATPMVAEFAHYMKDGRQDLRWRGTPRFSLPLLPLENDSPLHIALERFLQRHWFFRIWVQQEAAVNKNTSVVCGQKTCSWDQLYGLSWSCDYDWHTRGLTLSRKAWTACDSIDEIQKNRFVCCGDLHPPRLLQLLSMTSGCQCERPGDKIFALLGLIAQKDIDKYAPIPDYSIAPQTLFSNLAIRYLEMGNTSFLENAGRYRHELPDLPSWVPDWSWSARIDRWTSFKKFPFKSDGRVRMNRLGHIYITTGVLIDRLAFVSGVTKEAYWVQTQFSLHACQTLLSFLDRCITAAASSTIYGDQRDRAFLASLSDQHSALWDLIGDSRGSHILKSLRDWLSRESPVVPLSSSDHDLDPGTLVVKLESARIFDSRQFGVTERGRFCLLPPQARLNQSIAIITDSVYPLVIAPHGKYHEIIGPCYVQGIMDGELFGQDEVIRGLTQEHRRRERCANGDYSGEDTKLPFPPGWSVSSRTSESGWQFFEHLGLGIDTWQDPRFPHSETGPCPRGWRAGRCSRTDRPLGRRVYFINEETGDTTWDDPCLVDDPPEFPPEFPGFYFI